MQYLFIDTSSREQIRLALFSECSFLRELVSSEPRTPLVPLLSSFIHQRDVMNLNGVIVVQGPGSFSSIRSGVLVANLLSRLKLIPLYAVSVENSDNDAIQRMIACGTMKSVPYVQPVYDAEPNITC